jgi:hypothetical protein
MARRPSKTSSKTQEIHEAGIFVSNEKKILTPLTMGESIKFIIRDNKSQNLWTKSDYPVYKNNIEHKVQAFDKAELERRLSLALVEVFDAVGYPQENRKNLIGSIASAVQARSPLFAIEQPEVMPPEAVIAKTEATLPKQHPRWNDRTERKHNQDPIPFLREHYATELETGMTLVTGPH